MKYPIELVQERLDGEGVVLLEEYAELNPEPFLALLKKEYVPLQHKWSSLSGVALEKKLRPLLAGLEAFGTFTPELLVFEKGDYSILHDGVEEKGLTGFLCLSDWNYENGGYLGLDLEPVALPKGALLLVKGDVNWFVKKLNHYAEEKLVMLVLRSVS